MAIVVPRTSDGVVSLQDFMQTRASERYSEEQNCIKMRVVDTGQPPMSWNEYQAKLARGEIDAIQPQRHV